MVFTKSLTARSAIGAILACVLAGAVQAQTAVPNAYIFAQDGAHTLTSYGTTSLTTADTFGTATVQPGFVSAQGSSTGPSAGAGVGTVDLYFAVTCSAADPTCSLTAQVPLIMDASASASAGGTNAFAYGEVYVTPYGGGSTLVASACESTSNYCSAKQASDNVTYDFTNQAGEVGEVALIAGANSGQSGNASGEADPFLIVDPNYAGASNYSLQFSPGPNPDAAVPEPWTWAMMLIGLGTVGAAARTARRKTPGLPTFGARTR